MNKIKIATESQTLSFFRKTYGAPNRKKKIHAFYSSDFGKIITDEHLMLIPIDERMATRAHAVFDVLYSKHMNLINLESHINRLFNSAETVKINPPISKQQTTEVVQSVMSQICKKMISEGLSYEELTSQVFGIRLCISSGYGDFGIASLDKKPVFYMSVFEPYINYDVQKQGVKEFVVQLVKNPKTFVHTKTVNYIENALMANESKKQGGYQGIKALENGVLLQASMANIAFIFDREFATPRFQTVIEGTTIKKLLKYVEELKEKGQIQKISFRDIKIEEGEKATEMMIIGGDKIVPVLEFNRNKISSSKGKFTKLFQEWYEKENEVSNPIILNQ